MRVTCCLAAIAATLASAASGQSAPPASPQVYRLTPAEIARVQAEAAANPDDPYALGLTRRDNKVHGEIAAGIGTGGYRSLSGDIGVPLGTSGSAVLGFETGRFDNYRFGRRNYTGAYFGGSFGPGW